VAGDESFDRVDVSRGHAQQDRDTGTKATSGDLIGTVPPNEVNRRIRPRRTARGRLGAENYRPLALTN